MHYIQKWRRGAEIPMPHPYVYGIATDAAIYQLRKQGREKREVIEQQRKLAEEMKIKRGDFVVLRGEIYGHVERYIVPEEDIKLLLGIR